MPPGDAAAPVVAGEVEARRRHGPLAAAIAMASPIRRSMRIVRGLARIRPGAPANSRAGSGLWRDSRHAAETGSTCARQQCIELGKAVQQQAPAARRASPAAMSIEGEVRRRWRFAPMSGHGGDPNKGIWAIKGGQLAGRAHSFERGGRHCATRR